MQQIKLDDTLCTRYVVASKTYTGAIKTMHIIKVALCDSKFANYLFSIYMRLTLMMTEYTGYNNNLLAPYVLLNALLSHLPVSFPPSFYEILVKAALYQSAFK